MSINADHYIQYSAVGHDGRQYWECSCGHSGSVGEFGDVEIAAEKHIPGDETFATRSGGSW